VRTVVDEALRRYNPKSTDSEALREAVRRAARRAAQDAWGKKPVTRVTVVEL
jgi:ribonuclease J